MNLSYLLFDAAIPILMIVFSVISLLYLLRKKVRDYFS